MRGLRAISSLSVRLIAATIVSGLPFGAGSVANASDVGSTVGRVEIPGGGVGGRLGGGEGAVGGVVHFAIDVRGDRCQLLLGRESLAPEERAKQQDRIPLRLGLAFVRRLVKPLVVRQRVRVRTNHLGVDEGRAAALADVGDGVAHHVVAGDDSRCRRRGRPSATGTTRPAARDRRRASALRRERRSRSRCLRRGYRIGSCFEARGVERFPELAFARGAFADRHVGDFVRRDAREAIGDGLDAAGTSASPRRQPTACRACVPVGLEPETML